MKKIIFYLFPILLVQAACKQPVSENTSGTNEEITSLKKELDSLQKEISLLKEKTDEPDNKKNQEVKVARKEKEDDVMMKKTPEKRKTEPVKNPPADIQKDIAAKEDTVFYYYKGSKKVSAKISPWKNERRKLLLYDPFGNLTYEQEDARASYTIHTEIKEFHPNGAIARMVTRMNPGASLYTYETTVTFNNTNEPEWKTEMKQPASLNDYMNNKSWWDKKNKRWVKQEIVKEQPVPQE